MLPSLMALNQGVFHFRCNSVPRASPPTMTWRFLSISMPRVTRVPTTLCPAAHLGQVAWLEVVEANDLGAFADWGLPKDLFIPFAEQQYALSKGTHTLVRVYQDNQGRLAGSTRIDHWISDELARTKAGRQSQPDHWRQNGTGI